MGTRADRLGAIRGLEFIIYVVNINELMTLYCMCERVADAWMAGSSPAVTDIIHYPSVGFKTGCQSMEAGAWRGRR